MKSNSYRMLNELIIIIIDEKINVSVKEQASSIVLYLQSPDGMRHKEFIGFEKTSQTTEETLSQLMSQKSWIGHVKVCKVGFYGAANV